MSADLQAPVHVSIYGPSGQAVPVPAPLTELELTATAVWGLPKRTFRHLADCQAIAERLPVTVVRVPLARKVCMACHARGGL